MANPAKVRTSFGTWVDLATAIVNPTTLVPTGVINPFAGNTSPNGWLLCDGTVKKRADYLTLFNTIGTNYNTGGELSDEFRLPNLKGRTITGFDSSQTEFNTLGETGGAKTVTLDATQIPAHSHPNTATFSGSASNTGTVSSDHSHSLPMTYRFVPGNAGLGAAYFFTPAGGDGSGSTSGISANHTHSFTPSGTVSLNNANNTGGGGAHNNLQPYITLNYIIKT